MVEPTGATSNFMSEADQAEADLEAHLEQNGELEPQDAVPAFLKGVFINGKSKFMLQSTFHMLLDSLDFCTGLGLVS